ncbi:MAG TPA: hypothetical protein VHC18_06485 [Amycolatopsis sp.]|nr:hypothetical protein [Amycolatopsis sp.]
MLTTMPLCVALALFAWPAPRDPISRLLPPVPRRRLPTRLSGKKIAGLAVVALVPLLGLGGAIAAGLMTTAVWWQRRSRQRTKSRLATAKDLSEALRTVVAELRTGAPPALAAEAAAADTPQPVADLMRSLAVSARYGDESAIGDSSPIHRQLTKAWLLSRRHGLPLADLLDAVRRDIAANARFLARSDAHMSGPRASSAALAALPGLGLLLGQAIGARALHVLTGTSIGQLLLVVGAGLILAGIAWSDRLTRLEAAT